ncbi:MAG: GNAT family N-acetyltransferase [Clostridiaceae bacterium]|nr:GNAT family N-acetyltransferase [Clostridiaceae bacterium]
MESNNLYQVHPEDLPKLEALLTKCFARDPLYEELIPDETVRKRLMPELFACDMTEFYETCEIFADSKDLNGVLVVSDETEPYHLLKYYFNEMQASLRTDGYLIKEDHSLKTFFNFILGRDYLNSSWTDQLHQKKRIHIIYLAVDPDMQHHGIAAALVEEAIHYADRHKLMISLETHNPKNVAFYQQFGFKIFGIVEKHFELKQYCLIREAQPLPEKA